jgi:hypothetical protein
VLTTVVVNALRRWHDLLWTVVRCHSCRREVSPLKGEYTYMFLFIATEQHRFVHTVDYHDPNSKKFEIRTAGHISLFSHENDKA